MCCLGFFAIECGFQPQQLDGFGEPAGLMGSLDRDLRDQDHGVWDQLWLQTEHWENCSDDCGQSHVVGTELADLLMTTNDDNSDDSDEAEATREESLTNLFARIGVQVVFID